MRKGLWPRVLRAQAGPARDTDVGEPEPDIDSRLEVINVPDDDDDVKQPQLSFRKLLLIFEVSGSP